MRRRPAPGRQPTGCLLGWFGWARCSRQGCWVGERTRDVRHGGTGTGPERPGSARLAEHRRVDGHRPVVRSPAAGRSLVLPPVSCSRTPRSDPSSTRCPAAPAAEHARHLEGESPAAESPQPHHPARRSRAVRRWPAGVRAAARARSGWAPRGGGEWPGRGPRSARGQGLVRSGGVVLGRGCPRPAGRPAAGGAAVAWAAAESPSRDSSRCSTHCSNRGRYC
jgi:hypothetical protein